MRRWHSWTMRNVPHGRRDEGGRPSKTSPRGEVSNVAITRSDHSSREEWSNVAHRPITSSRDEVSNVALYL